jgi:hypothetical protein
MANTNCLEGMKCPQCKSEEPFRIHCTVIVLMEDYGSMEDLSGSEWDRDSLCECESCDYAGTVEDFTIDKTEAT